MQAQQVRPTKFLEDSKIAFEKTYNIKVPKDYQIQVYCFPKSMLNKKFHEFTAVVMFVYMKIGDRPSDSENSKNSYQSYPIHYEHLAKHNLQYLTFKGTIKLFQDKPINFFRDYFRVIISTPSGLNRYTKFYADKINEPVDYMNKYVNQFIKEEVEELPEDALDNMSW